MLSISKKKKSIFIVLLFSCQITSVHSQQLEKTEVEKHLKFLSSDQLKGRMTGTKENNQAAAYIADLFKKWGVKQVPGTINYFQKMSLRKGKPSPKNTLTIGGEVLLQKKDMALFEGGKIEGEFEAVFVNYGVVDEASKKDDYQGLDVKGKLVFALMGESENTPPMEAFMMFDKKRIQAAQKGAIGIVEFYNAPYPWQVLGDYLSQERYSMVSENEKSTAILHFLLNDAQKKYQQLLKSSKNLKVKVNTCEPEGAVIETQNVAGWIEGKDPRLKNEFVILSAHYDHVGGGKNTGSGGGMYAEDSIYNGARDNAMGTTALLEAARYFAKNPPARSVLLLAFTGEELGLLGSRFYADQSLVPLKQCVFNLNADGAGYNDKSKVTVIGLERTTAREMIDKACKENGLEAIPDPVPEQNLFDRSDNVSFAAKGIPAPTFAPGLTSFDAEIQKYYHQVDDEAETVDMNYLFLYVKSFVKSGELIANHPGKIEWIKGDKYEKAYKKLYGN